MNGYIAALELAGWIILGVIVLPLAVLALIGALIRWKIGKTER